MNKKKATLGVVAVGALAGGMFLGTAVGPVQAHTPGISASCNGVVLKASSYDGNKENIYEVTVGAVTTTGTFGKDLAITIPVPQEAATTSWSATIKAYDGGYSQTKSGSVGPCGRTTIQLPLLGVAPATCDTDGYFAPDFTSWPAAQNPNGYEGDGFRVYLDKAPAGPGTYTATLQRVGPGFDARYPNGTNVVGQTTQVLTLDAKTGFQSADPELPCFDRPDKPEVPLPVYNERVISTSDIDCDSTTAIDTFEWTETTSDFVWNEETKNWDAVGASSTGIFQGEPRPLNDTELAQQAKDCETPVIPPVDPPVDPEEPVIPETPVVPENPVTPEEPKQETPVKAVPVVEKTDELPTTGVTDVIPIGFAGALLLTLGVVLTVRRRSSKEI